jgi:hypothetical protein
VLLFPAPPLLPEPPLLPPAPPLLPPPLCPSFLAQDAEDANPPVESSKCSGAMVTPPTSKAIGAIRRTQCLTTANAGTPGIQSPEFPPILGR